MHIWTVERDPKTGVLEHRVASLRVRTLLAPIAAHGFRALRVSAAIWEHDADWFPIYTERNVGSFEVEYGQEEDRYDYNGRALAAVCERREAKLCERGGFSDLFAPIVIDGRAVAVLVTGPFATKRPTAESVADNWYRLTGRHARLSDPELARYLAATLSTLLLEGDHLPMFRRMVACCADLMAGNGDAQVLVNEWEQLRTRLERIRAAENAWDSVHEMIDERTARGWTRTSRTYVRGQLGLSRVPEGVAVGLPVEQHRSRDALERAFAHDTLQRRAVQLARAAGDAVAGRVGGHGVVLVVEGRGRAQATRSRLEDLSQRVSTVASRELTLDLCWGAALVARAGPLDVAYQNALAAAESALVRQERFVVASPLEARKAGSLEGIRRELGRTVEEQPDQLPSRFERYVQAVLARSGYRIDSVRTHLEVGFERVAEPLVASGSLDEQAFAEMCASLDRASALARTNDELLAAYRDGIVDLVASLERRTAARHDRAMDRALRFAAEHFTEHISVPQMAKIAGISRDYFSKLFRRREDKTFEEYLFELRIRRAKDLLARTELAANRVARLSGFFSSAHFCRAFRRAVGTTPLGYRASSRSHASSRTS